MRLTTETLANQVMLAGGKPRELVARAEADSPRRVVLDMDSTEAPVYGEQERSAYNGHFECICYHPLLLFNREGDCLAAKLRPGNVHSAEDWRSRSNRSAVPGGRSPGAFGPRRARGRGRPAPPGGRALTRRGSVPTPHYLPMQKQSLQSVP
jgi:Transposase DDE domain group 1